MQSACKMTSKYIFFVSFVSFSGLIVVEVGLLKNSKQVFLCCAVSDAGSQFPHLSVEGLIFPFPIHAQFAKLPPTRSTFPLPQQWDDIISKMHFALCSGKIVQFFWQGSRVRFPVMTFGICKASSHLFDISSPSTMGWDNFWWDQYMSVMITVRRSFLWKPPRAKLPPNHWTFPLSTQSFLTWIWLYH